VQLGDWLSKTGALGRLIFLAALGGVLAAATVLPVVAATGISVRNAANSFTTLSLNASSLPQRSEILDANGHLLTYVYGVDLGPGKKYTGVNRQPVGYNQISPEMLKSIVAIEDNRFWTRGALDIKGTIRALVNDLQHKPIQGASTIEQQYVKGVLVLQGLGSATAEQAATADTVSRKIDQLRMAVQVAHSMSKEQILAAYLNNSFYGSGAWGIEAAAETYFHTTAAKLSLTQAATLAGIVEDPSRYDPLISPATKLQSVERRNTVLARMMQTNVLSPADEAAAMRQKLVLHGGTVQSGCGAQTAGNGGFFCDYVMHTLLSDKVFGSTTAARAEMLATGGLKIYTTLDAKDQNAATDAAYYVVPANNGQYNPGHNVATEVLIQPGTGRVKAIAEDRPYGTDGNSGQTEVDYAVNSQQGGGVGVQTGSSSKLFTLITALEQGIPFGYTETVPYSATIGGFTNCQGAPAGYTPGPGQWHVVNASQGDKGTYTLYTGTADSINTFYAQLERKVGLCNVVHTAARLGVTYANGTSLLAGKNSADNIPSFTLGAVNVSPMSMANAYATVASGGMYCKPVVLSKIVNDDGRSLPVPQAGCHRVLSSDIAAAVNYILQGVFTWHGATGTGLGPIPGYQTAGKTGTSNAESSAVDNGTPYAAFAGYTTNLAGYVSVFNQSLPEKYLMGGSNSCYRAWYGGLNCPGEMFGANAPGSVWRATFNSASLGPSVPFGTVSQGSELWSKGNGMVTPSQPKKGGKGGKPGKGGGTGGTGGTGGNGGGTGGGGITGNPVPILPTLPAGGGSPPATG
jgi:membrane peptidoglycan carboxypeptidase